MATVDEILPHHCGSPAPGQDVSVVPPPLASPTTDTQAKAGPARSASRWLAIPLRSKPPAPLRSSRLTMSRAQQHADFPEARLSPNPIGSAPVFSVAVGTFRAFFLPACPRQKRMCADQWSANRQWRRAHVPKASEDVRFRRIGVGESLAGRTKSFPASRSATVPLSRNRVTVHATAASTRGRTCFRQGGGRSAKAARRCHLWDGDDTWPKWWDCAAKCVSLGGAESCTGGLLWQSPRRNRQRHFGADAVRMPIAPTRLSRSERSRGHGAVARMARHGGGMRRLCTVATSPWR